MYITLSGVTLSDCVMVGGKAQSSNGIDKPDMYITVAVTLSDCVMVGGKAHRKKIVILKHTVCVCVCVRVCSVCIVCCVCVCSCVSNHL